MKKIFRSLIPANNPTRWTNIRDILSWGIKNRMRLFALLTTPNPIIRGEIENERDLI